MKLNLASGNMYLEGYVNIDDCSMPTERVDMKADIFELIYKSRCIEDILVCHFMMYVDSHMARILFQRWFDWLIHGGILIIETGDFNKIIKKPMSEALVYLFGWEETKGHKWSWSEDSLISLLKAVGFDIVKVSDGGFHNRPDRDITIIAKKP